MHPGEPSGRPGLRSTLERACRHASHDLPIKKQKRQPVEERKRPIGCKTVLLVRICTRLRR